MVGAVARQVVLLLLFCRIGLLHLVILARLLRLVTWGGVRLLRGLVALGGVRFLPMFVLCDLLLRWILRRNLVVMFLLDDAGRRSGWASVLASSPRPFLDLQFSIEVVLSVLFHAPRSSHAGSATVEGEQVRLILTASYCSPARPSHGERRLSLLRHAAYPLQRRFLVPLASSGHHRLSLCLLVCGTRCVPRLAPLDVALFYLPFFLDHSCAASGGAVVRFGFGSWPSNPVVQCC